MVALGLPPPGAPQIDIAGWAEDAVGRCDGRVRGRDSVCVRVRATARAQDAVGRRDVRGRGCGWR